MSASILGRLVLLLRELQEMARVRQALELERQEYPPCERTAAAPVTSIAICSSAPTAHCNDNAQRRKCAFENTGDFHVQHVIEPQTWPDASPSRAGRCSTAGSSSHGRNGVRVPTRRAHPNALYAHLDMISPGPSRRRRGRHPLPAPGADRGRSAVGASTRRAGRRPTIREMGAYAAACGGCCAGSAIHGWPC